MQFKLGFVKPMVYMIYRFVRPLKQSREAEKEKSMIRKTNMKFVICADAVPTIGNGLFFAYCTNNLGSSVGKTVWVIV